MRARNGPPPSAPRHGLSADRVLLPPCPALPLAPCTQVQLVHQETDVPGTVEALTQARKVNKRPAPPPHTLPLSRLPSRPAHAAHAAWSGLHASPHPWSVERAQVVIVPGYGLAVANAQYAVAELVTQLKDRGVDIKFGVHPVAGRMPGERLKGLPSLLCSAARSTPRLTVRRLTWRVWGCA